MWQSANPGVGIGIPAFVGLVGGVLAGLGWRYTVPRESVDANPPYLPPGVSGYIVRLNGYEYVGGPSWWPILMLAVIGLMLGVAAGMTRMAIGREMLRSDSVSNMCAAGVAGGLTGLCGAVVAHWAPPLIRVVDASGPRQNAYNVGPGFSGLTGAPPYWEFSPTFVWFPVVGAMFGVAAAAVLLLGIRTRHLWGDVDDDAAPKSILRVPIDALPWLFVALSPVTAFVLLKLGDEMAERRVSCNPLYSIAIEGGTEDVQAQNVLIAGSMLMIAIGVVTLLAAIWKRRTMGRYWRRRLSSVCVAAAVALVAFVILIATSDFPIELSCT